jgi:predicted dehydrogenase
MKKIRFGITGSGYMGRTHAEAVQFHRDTAELVAIWGGSRAESLAARCGVVAEPTMESLMARKDIDAIIITTPQHVHCQEAVLAMQSGKHVLCEKPMATKVEDCDRMLAAAVQYQRVLSLAYNLRFRINLPHVKRLIAEGAIGKVQSMHYSMIRQASVAANFGGNKTSWVELPEIIGFVIDALPHGIDAIRWSTGAEVKRVAGFSRTFLEGRQIEDTTVGIMEYTNGAICSVHITKASDGEYKGEMARLSMVGSKGNLEMDGFGDLYLSDRANGWRRVSTQPPVNPDDPDAAFKEGRMLAFRNQVKAFMDTINGQSTPLATGRDGRQGLAACLALIKSSAENRFVELS